MTDLKQLSGPEFLRTWYQRVWADGDRNAISQMMAPDAQLNGLGSSPIMGPREFEQLHDAMFAYLEDISIKVEKTLVDGVWTTALCTVKATSRSNHKTAEMSGVVVARIEDGLVQEGYDSWNFVNLWEELGFLPEGSFERAIKGNIIH